LVEQRIENPRVGGSIPSLATKDFSGFALTQIQSLMPASLIKQLAGICLCSSHSAVFPQNSRGCT
jgi:hypothetical protein